MTHFICTGGCNGVSDRPGTCQVKGCPKHGQPLEHCECNDNRHHGRQDEQASGEEKERRQEE